MFTNTPYRPNYQRSATPAARRLLLSPEDSAPTSATSSSGVLYGAVDGTLYFDLETVYSQAGHLPILMCYNDGTFKDILIMTDALHNDPNPTKKHTRYSGPARAINDHKKAYQDVKSVIGSVKVDLISKIESLTRQLNYLEEEETDLDGTLQLHGAFIAYCDFVMDEYEGQSYPIAAISSELLSHFLARPQLNLLSVTPFQLDPVFPLYNQAILDLPKAKKLAICQALHKAEYYKNIHVRKLLNLLCHPLVKAVHAKFSQTAIYYNKSFDPSSANVFMLIYSAQVVFTKLYNFTPTRGVTERLIQEHPSLTVLDRIKLVDPVYAQELLDSAPFGVAEVPIPGPTFRKDLEDLELPPSKLPSSISEDLDTKLPPSKLPSSISEDLEDEEDLELPPSKLPPSKLPPSNSEDLDMKLPPSKLPPSNSEDLDMKLPPSISEDLEDLDKKLPPSSPPSTPPSTPEAPPSTPTGPSQATPPSLVEEEEEEEDLYEPSPATQSFLQEAIRVCRAEFANFEIRAMNMKPRRKAQAFAEFAGRAWSGMKIADKNPNQTYSKSAPASEFRDSVIEAELIQQATKSGVDKSLAYDPNFPDEEE